MIIEWLPVVIWIYLLLGRGFYWRANGRTPGFGARRAARVMAIIPARNESESIGAAVASIKDQVAGIMVVDDHSSDNTATLAAAAGATVVAADPLPPGWTGKLWALQCGLRRAGQADFVLFTDADIVHGPGSLARLVAIAQADQLDLASVMVKLRCESLSERSLIPAFVYFFLQLYPPDWRTGAAGGCILIRPQALDRIGGLDRIKGELIDDCALAREVRKGGRIWMGLTEETVSVRSYGTFAEVGHMIARTAFTQLRYSPLILLGTLIGLAVTYLAPPVLTLFGPHRLPGAVAWVIMAFTFLPVLRLYRRSWLWSFALPAIAVFYMGATVQSAMNYWRGKGGQWKGRVMPSPGAASVSHPRSPPG